MTKCPRLQTRSYPSFSRSCCVSNAKLWESEGAGCVTHSRFMYVRVCLCKCVCLFCLTDVPSLQGPVIKPLCTQPQSLAYIYLLFIIHWGFVHVLSLKHPHTLTHKTTYVFPILNLMQGRRLSCMVCHQMWLFLHFVLSLSPFCFFYLICFS